MFTLIMYGHNATLLQEDETHVSVLCEYDALPEIGHACGHNLIAECGVAAGIGIKAAMDNAGRNIGKVTTTSIRKWHQTQNPEYNIRTQK